MSPSHASRRKPSTDALLIAAALAVGIHVLVLGGLDAADIHVRGGIGKAPEATAAAAARRTVKPLRPSCDGDAVLMAAARALQCASPTVADGAACLGEVDAQLERDFLLCHAQAVELPPVEVTMVEPERIAEIEPIEAEALLDELTPEQLQQHQEQLQQIAMAPPPPPPPPPPPQQPKPPLETQVIETAKPDQEVAPDDARFLSEYDQKVDKQTVKHGNPDEEIAKAPKPAELAKKVDARDPNQPEPPKDEVPPAPDDAKDAPPNQGQLSMRRPGTPEPAEVPQERRVAGDDSSKDEAPGDGAARKRGDGDITQDERKPTEAARGEGGAGGGQPRAPNLRPTEEIYERVIGGGSVDHVEDVDEGDENAFNSKRWVYASFFNRVKRMVAQNWDPASVWQREDPDGSVHGTKTRVTRVRVALDKAGELRKIVVVTASGAPVLDEEAVRAFRAAGPFPNPPQQLVDADGFIGFQFSFHFEIDERRSSWKIYRSQ
jgi:TonB family protein